MQYKTYNMINPYTLGICNKSLHVLLELNGLALHYIANILE